MDTVIINKINNIARCLDRIRKKYHGNEQSLHKDLDIQDIIVLNLERACQCAIDLGMYIIRKKRLGLPRESADAFELLEKAGILSSSLSIELKKMVGFRNLVTHEYQNINYDIVKNIIVEKLKIFEEFNKTALSLAEL